MEPLEVFPATGGVGVALNARVRAVFPAGTLGAGDAGAPDVGISLFRCTDADCAAPEPVGGQTLVLDDTVAFEPDAPLAPNTLYFGEARGPDGVVALRFSTGDAVDVVSPELGEVISVSSTPTETCDPDVVRRVSVTFVRALDDGPAGDIEYLLYLSRARGLEAPSLRARRRNFGATTEITMPLLLTEEEVRSGICVSVIAADGVGNLDADGEPTCFDPKPGAYFEGLCAVRGAGAPSAGAGARAMVLALVALVALGALCGRRRVRARR